MRHIAYQVLGERGPDLLYLSSGTISIDSIDEELGFAWTWSRDRVSASVTAARGSSEACPIGGSSTPSPRERTHNESTLGEGGDWHGG